jgi:hypothetical protein
MRETEPGKKLARSGKWAEGLAFVIFLGFVLHIYLDSSSTATLKIVDAAIAAATLAQLIFAWKARQAEDELQRISDEKIAETNVRAAEANKIAKEAELKLEQYKAPRILTEEQRHRIARALGSFENHVLAGAIPPTAEAGALAGALVDVLQRANIKARIGQNQIMQDADLDPRWPSKWSPLENLRPGVSIRFTTGNQDGEKFATLLAQLLNAEGILASADSGLQEARAEGYVLAQGSRNDEKFGRLAVIVGEKR